MAQWSREERTLHAKIVYYGPAMGGKTANLEALQRMTDAHGAGKLLSTQTTDDRTLFFDLLTINLPDVLGYKIRLKLYTVPGQVRYDTARQVVLSGADAIVFVADSCPGREEQNRWSVQNLQMNMRSRGLDPARVPVVYQFNKQDAADAADPEEVASWLRIPDGLGTPAVAREGRGVLETFEETCGTMLERLIAQADESTLEDLDRGEIGAQLKRACSPFVARREWSLRTGECMEKAAIEGRGSIAAKGEDLLQDAIWTSARLGEWYSNETAMRRRLGREGELYRKLDAIDGGAGAGLEREEIVDAHLGAVADALNTGVVSLICQSESGAPLLDRAWGRPDDPLLASAWGRRLLREMFATSQPIAIEDLGRACEEAEAMRHLNELRSIAAVPVGACGTRLLLAYAGQPDGRFNRRDLRFLAAAAVKLDAALQRAGLHEELEGQRDRMKVAFDRRSEQLRQARLTADDLERSHNELLSAIPEQADEMLADARHAAHLLRDKRIQGTKRADALKLIIEVIERLQEQQRLVIDRGAKFREQLDGFLRLTAPPGAGEPDDQNTNERESECEVLNVG